MDTCRDARLPPVRAAWLPVEVSDSQERAVVALSRRRSGATGGRHRPTLGPVSDLARANLSHIRTDAVLPVPGARPRGLHPRRHRTPKGQLPTRP